MSTPLAQAQQYMSLYGLSTFLIFGTIGNFLLICILVQPTHRRNSCSLYLLSATIVNFILIECILPIAVYSANNIDPQNISVTWCKIRSYLFNSLLMLYRWYKMAACIDRAAMCSRHAWIRSFSEARIARRVILITTVIWLLIPIHLAVYFRIESGRCVPQSGTYAKFFSAYSVLISGWSPPIVMAIFGAISYRNLRKIRARVIPAAVGDNRLSVVNTAISRHDRVGKRDQQLIILLVCEVLVYISTNLLYSINITYLAITSDLSKSIDRIRIESFIAYFSSPFLIIINNCAPFYLYLIVSSKFRKDVRNLLSCHFFHAHRQVVPGRTDPRQKMSGSTALHQRATTRIHH